MKKNSYSLISSFITNTVKSICTFLKQWFGPFTIFLAIDKGCVLNFRPGLPKHKLKLKVGDMVMLTRNVNQVFGLCNGTRMVVKKLFKWTIECEVITGSHAGSRHIIPRMTTTHCDNN